MPVNEKPTNTNPEPTPVNSRTDSSFDTQWTKLEQDFVVYVTFLVEKWKLELTQSIPALVEELAQKDVTDLVQKEVAAMAKGLTDSLLERSEDQRLTWLQHAQERTAALLDGIRADLVKERESRVAVEARLVRVEAILSNLVKEKGELFDLQALTSDAWVVDATKFQEVVDEYDAFIAEGERLSVFFRERQSEELARREREKEEKEVERQNEAEARGREQREREERIRNLEWEREKEKRAKEREEREAKREREEREKKDYEAKAQREWERLQGERNMPSGVGELEWEDVRAMQVAWNEYERQWQDNTQPLTFGTIRWPMLGRPRTVEDIHRSKDEIQAFLLSPYHSGGLSARQRIKAARLRWHPDKFSGRMARVAEGDRELVRQGLTELLSCFTLIQKSLPDL